MLGTAQEMNAILERVGSDVRVSFGDPMAKGVNAMLDVIPDYIDRRIEEVLAKRRVEQDKEQSKPKG